MKLSKKDMKKAYILLSSACNLLCDCESEEYDGDTCPIKALRGFLTDEEDRS